MTRWISTLAISAMLAPAADVPKIDSAALKSAVTRAMLPLEKQSPVFVKTGGCNSCHNQDLPVAAQTLARERGIPAGGDIALFDGVVVDTDRMFEHAGGFGVGSTGYLLMQYAARKRPADAVTDAAVLEALSTQESDGRWRSRSNRQPLTTGDHFSTAFGIYTLRHYARGVMADRAPLHISRAVSWLRENPPVSNQDAAFQVMGLVWGKAEDLLGRATATLVSRQRPDGGWAQIPSLQSDAYATGQSLYALALSGMSPSNAAYRRGLDYLLRTQSSDGTWHVKARSKPVQPYFDAGYPGGHDQWISAAGASWAVMAMSMAVER